MATHNVSYQTFENFSKSDSMENMGSTEIFEVYVHIFIAFRLPPFCGIEGQYIPQTAISISTLKITVQNQLFKDLHYLWDPVTFVSMKYPNFDKLQKETKNMILNERIRVTKGLV